MKSAMCGRSQTQTSTASTGTVSRYSKVALAIWASTEFYCCLYSVSVVFTIKVLYELNLFLAAVVPSARETFRIYPGGARLNSPTEFDETIICGLNHWLLSLFSWIS